MVVVAPDGRVCRSIRKQPSFNMRSALRSMCMYIAHVIPHGCKHFGADANGCCVTVSYCETFLSSSEASSTNQDSFTKPQLARIQRSKRRIASTWFCNVHASFIGHVIGIILPLPILPRKCIISLIPIIDPIIGAYLIIPAAK